MKRNFDNPEYKRWRKEVYSRDGFMCQWPHCNKKRRLNAHHIKRWSDFPGLRFVVDNGITLCKDHHDMINGLEDVYASTFMMIVANNKNEK
jgi:hypothetical protein